MNNGIIMKSTNVNVKDLKIFPNDGRGSLY